MRPEVLLFSRACILMHIRSDNGPHFIAHNLRNWLAAVGAKTT